MELSNLIQTGANINVTISLDDLRTFSNELIQQTKTDLEAVVNAELAETHLTTNQVSDYLGVNLSTLWRWAKRGYIVPIEVGGKRLYKMSEVKAILNGGRK